MAVDPGGFVRIRRVTGFPKMPLVPFRLIVNVVRRFRAERYAQTAAALSFATLLGLVPVLVVGARVTAELPAVTRK